MNIQQAYEYLGGLLLEDNIASQSASIIIHCKDGDRVIRLGELTARLEPLSEQSYRQEPGETQMTIDNFETTMLFREMRDIGCYPTVDDKDRSEWRKRLASDRATVEQFYAERGWKF